MSNELPKLDKSILSVSRLDDVSDEKEYWLSKTPIERLKALEINRRMVYGYDRTASRLQRFLEVAELK
jgi:hypothetical protein